MISVSVEGGEGRTKMQECKKTSLLYIGGDEDDDDGKEHTEKGRESVRRVILE